MSTFWVNNITGDNTFDGSSATVGIFPVGPKASIDGATGGLSLVDTKGDILNIVNTGTTYDIAVNTNIGGGGGGALNGTDFTIDPGCIIRGTDSSGALSMVKVRHTAAVLVIGVREGHNYVVVQGLHVDRPNATPVSSALTFININDSGGGVAGPILVKDCIDESTTTKSGFFIRDVTGTAVSQELIEVTHCFLKNWSTNGGIEINVESHRRLYVHHNVFWYDVAATSPNVINLGTNDNNAAVDHEVIHNTIVGVTGRISFLTSACTNATGASASAQKKCHSNVFAQFSASAGNDSFMTGSSTWEGIAWTGTRTIGWNVFVDPTSHAWAAAHPYQVPWDPDNTDGGGDVTSYWPTDTIDEAVDADPFEDRLTPWDWAVDGYTITLPGDLRLIQYRTAGKDSAVPGAIPEAVGVPSDPPIFDPGPGGLPVGPTAPAFLFDGPDGINAAFHIRRNTESEAHQYFEGVQESVTHVGASEVIVNTNVANIPVSIIADSRALMVQTDAPVTITLDSHQIQLLAGGCILVDGANLQTLTVTNISTIRTAKIRISGAN